MGHSLLRAGVEVLVKFEGVLNMACFKESTIACTKLHHIACVDTNPNTKSAARELTTRARPVSVRSTTEKISETRVKKTVGGLPSSDQAYTTTPCLAFVEVARRCALHFRFSSASSCSRRYCSVKMGGIYDAHRGSGWASRERSWLAR